MLKSSIMGIPKFISGLSLQCLSWFGLGLCRPLFNAQSTIALSDNSVYCGFLDKNTSRRSKVPSSGKPMGNIASYLPSFGVVAGKTSASASAMPCTMWHVNGNGADGAGPKFICSVTFLKLTCGCNTFPRRPSGNGCGVDTRLPSQKQLTVLPFGLSLSKFSNTPMTWSRAKCVLHWVRFPSAVKKPSESKQMLASFSPRKSELPQVEKPTRTSCLGAGGRTLPLAAGSMGCSAS
mmetsp:Transcript_6800/g.16922  ORF Transcript_6800/g.16922 Transcript_6800/m.16922 type:complete len:235 (-) Transcript_6800:389-1093(-)